MKIRFKHNYIALADILANGIAIMLILIVLSLSLKQQQQEQELQQITEVGTVMSRDISSSIIMNNLPSSGPARLHNYSHKRYQYAPLIQIHKDFLLIKDNGNHAKPLNWKIPQAELLLKNNRFDTFLKSLNKFQKPRIRVDIINIKLFYLVMSIVKANKTTIRHWHFDTYKTKIEPQKSYDLKELQVKSKNIEPNSVEGDLFSEKKKQQQDTEEKILPDDIEFSEIKDPFNSSQINKAPSYGITKEKSQSKTQQMLDEMTKMFAKNRGLSRQLNQKEFLKNLEISFTGKKGPSKNISKQQGKGKRENQKSLFDQNSKTPVQKQLLDLLLNYLNKVQVDYDNHKFIDPSLEDFAKHAKQTEGYQNDIDMIYNNYLKEYKPNPLILTQFKRASTNGIKLVLNQNLAEVWVFSSKKIPWLDSINKFETNLYAQPTISEAQPIKLKTTDIILLPYENSKSLVNKWFIVAVLNHKLDKIKIGFVYGKQYKNQLLLANSENNLRINDVQMIDTYESKQNYYHLIKLLIILILTLLVVFLIFRKKK
jgi:hypothetical protein